MEKTLSQLIQNAQSGDREAASALWAQVYDEVRAAAQRAVAGEFQPVSVQATELAHEAYLRLANQIEDRIENRAHLVAIVAQAIRRLLVDRARARKAAKRGGGSERVPLDEVLDQIQADTPELVDLDAALIQLEQVNARHAKLVELRFFGGMTMEEAAETLGVSLRTAAGDWALAKAWLRRQLDS